MIRARLAVPLLVVLAGCVNTTVGHRLGKDPIKDLVPGRTQAEELKAWFGDPLHRTRVGDREIWTYRFIEEQGTFQEFIVTLDDDLVTTWSDNSSQW